MFLGSCVCVNFHSHTVITVAWSTDHGSKNPAPHQISSRKSSIYPANPCVFSVVAGSDLKVNGRSFNKALNSSLFMAWADLVGTILLTLEVFFIPYTNLKSFARFSQNQDMYKDFEVGFVRLKNPNEYKNSNLNEVSTGLKCGWNLEPIGPFP